VGLVRCGAVFPLSVVVGAAGSGVPLVAVPALSWCREVSLRGIHIIISTISTKG